MNIPAQIESLTQEWYAKHLSAPNVLRMSMPLYRAFNEQCKAQLLETVASSYFPDPLDKIRMKREFWEAEERGISGYHSNFGFLRIHVIDTHEEVLEVAREITTEEALRMKVET